MLNGIVKSSNPCSKNLYNVAKEELYNGEEYMNNFQKAKPFLIDNLSPSANLNVYTIQEQLNMRDINTLMNNNSLLNQYKIMPQKDNQNAHVKHNRDMSNPISYMNKENSNGNNVLKQGIYKGVASCRSTTTRNHS